MMNTSVLVLDAHVPHTVTIVRGLAAYGLRVTAASSHNNAIAFYCKNVTEKKLYPDPIVDRDAFINWVINECAHGRYSFIIPTTDATGLPLSEHYERISSLVPCAVLPYEKNILVHDKEKTMAIAQKSGVPIPRSVCIASAKDPCIADLESWNYPVVLKPIKSLVQKEGSDFERMTVCYAKTYSYMVEQLSKICPVCPVLVQEYIGGDGVGVEVLCKDGVVLSAFQHRRIHELPLTGGGSTYRKSEGLDQTLLSYSRKIIESIGWTGVAMVEFKHDRRSGRAAFMEINGRFWGSLPLSYKAGINFPALLYQVMVENKKCSQVVYKENVYCRNELGDIAWFKENLRHQNDPNPLVKWIPWWQALRDALHVVLPSHHFDILHWSDGKVSMEIMKRIIQSEIAALSRKLKKRS